METEEMEEVHLSPFRSAIDEGVSAIMTSHAIYPSLDSELPATLSSAILTHLLREKMGFEGPVITDDLEMGAIAKKWGVAEGAAGALIAGADILLVCEDQGNFLDSLGLIRGRVLQGKIPYQRVQQSNERIRKAKERFLEPGEKISFSKVREYFGVSA